MPLPLNRLGPANPQPGCQIPEHCHCATADKAARCGFHLVTPAGPPIFLWLGVSLLAAVILVGGMAAILQLKDLQ